MIKTFRNHWIVPLVVCMTFVVMVLGGIRQAAMASIWTETPAAGDLPATAQQTFGTGSLDRIVGTLSVVDDIDMFLIRIPDPSLFSATTVNPPANTEFLDTQLFLFDANGRGVAANGDVAWLETNASIPAGSVAGAPGLYFLAVAEFDDFPVSPSGRIFPDLFSESDPGAVEGPTGPGGADPVSAWEVDNFSESQFPPYPMTYEMVLTGAEFANVPEVSSLLIWLVGILVISKSARKNF